MEYTREQAEQVFKDSCEFFKTEINDVNVIKFLNHKFPQLPERGWLKHFHGAIVFRTGARSGYGLNCGDWEIDDYWTFHIPKEWRPATEEEVITMLKEQAEKMGYVKGVKVKCLFDGKVYTLDSVKNSNSVMDYGRFWFRATGGNGVKIMDNGKWAEIIADDLQERFDALVKEAKERGKNVTVKFE
jgi:hypothetical protein